jgi:hypothetical protein
MTMNTLKLTTIVLAVGFAAAIGCGSDSGDGKTDAPVINNGTGGARTDGGLGGTTGAGGMTGAGGTIATGGITGAGGSALDAPSATGGAGGSRDGGGIDSAPIDAPAIDAPASEAGTAGETAPATNLCTGLSATACDQAVRNAPVDNTVVAQDVPLISATSYPACSQ